MYAKTMDPVEVEVGQFGPFSSGQCLGRSGASLRMLADTVVTFIADWFSIVPPTKLLALTRATTSSAECGMVNA